MLTIDSKGYYIPTARKGKGVTMAKGTKKIGPKEAGLRAMRGGTALADGAADILKQLESDEAEAFKKFQDDQRAKREKALTDVIEPLRKQRAQLADEVNQANSAISDIDREIAKLTGRPASKMSAGVRGTGARFRPTEEQLQEAAEQLGGHFKKWGKKNEVSRKAIISQMGDRWATHIPKLVERWNKANSDAKIGTNGKEKALSRYLMH
jgi:hypothetical protein